MNKLYIRRLTPLECCRLMGFSEEDFNSMKEAGLSDSQIYHCCGDSIVSTCLVSIFSSILGKDSKLIIEDYVDKIKSKEI